MCGERLFLLRRLLPWHRNEAKRLIKDTQDSFRRQRTGPPRWPGCRSKTGTRTANAFGHLLETWAAQQIITRPAGPTRTCGFWHYRDKDQVEVDLVITRGRHTWGVEVKSFHGPPCRQTATACAAWPSDAARTIGVVSCCMQGTVLSHCRGTVCLLCHWRGSGIDDLNNNFESHTPVV